MKKLLMLFVLFAALSSLYSAGIAEDDTQVLFVESSSYLNLSMTEKILIYQQNKINPTGPFLLNFFIGGGIGSIAMGDQRGYGFLSLDLTFGALLIGLTVSSIKVDPGFIALMAIPLIGGRIFQMILPFQYAKEENTKLRNSLGLNLTLVSLSGPRDELGIQVAATISF